MLLISKKCFKLIIYNLLIFFLLLIPLTFSSAQDLGGGGGGGKIENPLQGNDNLLQFFNTLLDKVVIPIGAILAVIFIILSGYYFVTAGGDEGKIKTARMNILYVVIGAGIIIGCKVILAVIQGTLNSIQ